MSGFVSIENTVYLHDFSDDDVIEYAKELIDDSNEDEKDEELNCFIYPKSLSLLDEEKIKLFLENYENIKLEDLENLI